MNRVFQLYKDLLEKYGQPQWWPAESPFEVAAGAILTQNTNWKNVEKAITKLKGLGLMTAESIVAVDTKILETAIRSSGYFRQKAERLKILSRFLMDKYLEDGVLTEGLSPNQLRAGLLALKGVGPETADCILLYAFDLPFFVIDAYTRRFVKKHSLCAPDLKYEKMRKFFEINLPKDARIYNQYHALIIIDGKAEQARTYDS
ncbi:endonuclease III domain-containing protein [bacterium]|nr:endonuclease III domain-containing protein [bacterium]